ncbi:hypothetical protein LJR125_003712 [Pseudoxanthomonas sp. LjRoot125]|uniref:hypothetical protein n=1 Tax=Pseudoxanthomonas sp. LjRoot125 TaxID=3342258 RepID=UPI003E113729
MTPENFHSAPEGHRDSQSRADTKVLQALHEKLDRLMAKAKPTKREMTLQQFRDLYPRLESYLASGKLLKDVLVAFNELTQAKVCARKFNDMLDHERARRDAAGNPICCTACGQPLKAPQKVQAAVTTPADATTHSE